MKTKNVSKVKTLMFVLVGALAFSCENEGIMELERPIPTGLSPTGVIRPLPCLGSDPAVAAIHIDYSTFPINVLYPGDPSPKFNFTIDFTNLGYVAWNLEGAAFQCYRSKDAIYGNLDDIPAGGALLGPFPPTLSYGQVYTDNWYNVIFTPDFADYPYLIVALILPPRTPDCTTSNNFVIEKINFPIVEDRTE